MMKFLMVVSLSLLVTGCSCKDWGYCLHLFPDAERFTEGVKDPALQHCEQSELNRAASGA